MNSVPENYEPPKSQFNIFNEYETMELLKLVEAPEIQKLFSTYRKKHKFVWQLISSLLAEKGIHKSEEKCSNRFENMKAKFFKIEKRRMQGYQEDIDWPYYQFFVRYMNSNNSQNFGYESSQNLYQQELPNMHPHLHQTFSRNQTFEIANHFDEGDPRVQFSGYIQPKIEINHSNPGGDDSFHYGYNTSELSQIQQDIKPIIEVSPETVQPRTVENLERSIQHQTEDQPENQNIESQQILLSPAYVHKVEKLDSENDIEMPNVSPEDPSITNLNRTNQNSSTGNSDDINITRLDVGDAPTTSNKINTPPSVISTQVSSTPTNQNQLNPNPLSPNLNILTENSTNNHSTPNLIRPKSSQSNNTVNNQEVVPQISGTPRTVPLMQRIPIQPPYQNQSLQSNRISPNLNSTQPKLRRNEGNIARKFKRIKIDEELLAVRKEKHALELEILRFQLDNEKKLNEKHSLDIKILEMKLKSEVLQNQLLEIKINTEREKTCNGHNGN